MAAPKNALPAARHPSTVLRRADCCAKLATARRELVDFSPQDAPKTSPLQTLIRIDLKMLGPVQALLVLEREP